MFLQLFHAALFILLRIVGRETSFHREPQIMSGFVVCGSPQPLNLLSTEDILGSSKHMQVFSHRFLPQSYKVGPLLTSFYQWEKLRHKEPRHHHTPCWVLLAVLRGWSSFNLI